MRGTPSEERDNDGGLVVLEKGPLSLSLDFD
jgi:hypothetical protein